MCVNGGKEDDDHPEEGALSNSVRSTLSSLVSSEIRELANSPFAEALGTDPAYAERVARYTHARTRDPSTLLKK